MMARTSPRCRGGPGQRPQLWLLQHNRMDEYSSERVRYIYFNQYCDLFRVVVVIGMGDIRVRVDELQRSD